MIYGTTYAAGAACALLFTFSIAVSGCATRDRGSIVRGQCGIDKIVATTLPEEVETIQGVHVQLAVKQRTWDVGQTPLLYASAVIDEEAADDVFLATNVGLACRVSTGGRWYTHPQTRLTGIPYQNIRKVSMQLTIRLDKSWQSMDGGKALALSKGSHKVRFAWAGYRTSQGREQPLLLLSNEVEIVIAGE